MEQIFNLKFTSKQLVRGSKRAEKDEKSEKLKVKKAIEKGNIDGAKIYAQASTAEPTPYPMHRLCCDSRDRAPCLPACTGADQLLEMHLDNAHAAHVDIAVSECTCVLQNAIRKKTEALNYLRLASRLDAVVSRLDTQVRRPCSS